MKPNVLIAGCLALLILCTCAVAGAQAAELYAEPDAELGEWSDLEVTPTAAVNLTVVDGAESSSTLMGECTTVSKLVTDEPEVLETTVGFEAHITTTDDENCLTTSATTSLYEIAVNNAKKLEGVDYLWGGRVMILQLENMLMPKRLGQDMYIGTLGKLMKMVVW